MSNRIPRRIAATIVGIVFAVFYLLIPERPLVFLVAFSLLFFLGATDFGRQCPLLQGLKNVIVKRKNLYDDL